MAQAFAKEKFKERSNERPHVYNQAVENSLSHRALGYVVNSHHANQSYRFREEVKNYEPLIDGLEHAFSNSLFCCGGSFQTSDMDTFVLKVRPKDSDDDKESWKEFSLGNVPAEELLEYCTPAPFGDLKEMKTVLDTEVRSAYEIKTGRFKVLSEPNPKYNREIEGVPGAASIYKHVGEELTPGREFKTDRNKLNIYGKGGFFKSHVDSPSSDSMIGTLVICLPSPHKGGELVVYHDGLQHIFDFSEHAGDTKRVHWAAFYSDCIHEVKPVLEGHRVTVTYNITLSRLKNCYFEWNRDVSREKLLDANEHFEPSARCPTRSLANVDRALRNIRQGKKSPSRVGFLLKHKYTVSGLQPQLLKGEDKELFDYLNANQWKCMLKSVLSRYQTTTVGVNFEDMDYEETHEIYEFIPSNSAMPFTHNESPLMSSMHRAFQGTTIRDLSQWRVGIPFVEIYRKPDDTKLLRNNEGMRSWVGNEVHDVGVDKIYLDSAVILEFGRG